jgi:hypothetical protein
MRKYWSQLYDQSLTAKEMARELISSAIQEACPNSSFKLKKLEYFNLGTDREYQMNVSGIVTLDGHFTRPLTCMPMFHLNSRDCWESQPFALPLDLERSLIRVSKQRPVRHSAKHSVPIRTFRPAMQS